MASNKWTAQDPIANNSTRSVLAERVFVNAADALYSDPTAKLDGGDPTAWSGYADLGIVAGSKATLTYNKEVKYIETGIDKVRRGVYLVGKSAQLAFTLEQYDMGVMEKITGLSKIAVGVIGSKMHVGQEDIVEKSLLILGTNKIDGKEHHIYCKKAGLTFQLAEQDDARVINVTAELYGFVASGQTTSCLFSLFILN